MRILLVSLYTSICIFSYAQKQPEARVDMMTSGTKTSLRGLSVVTDNFIWVSGSNGTVGRSINGGADWKWFTVKGFEKADFRDIEAFDGLTAVIMAVGEPAYVLRTVNGGESWKVVYENKTKGMFLDAMEFWNEQSGIIIGDPIEGRMFITRTFDGGATWQDVPMENRPVADSGEACFAASGTNIRALDNDEAVFVTGGLKSSLFIRDKKTTLPIIQGKETTGANSIAVWNRFKRKGGNNLVVVGGDFDSATSSAKNCFFSENRGLTWTAPTQPPHGYRSCVEFITRKTLLSCGLTGVDISWNGGRTWNLISNEGFHVCRVAKNGTAVFLAGSNGKIGKFKKSN